MDPLLRKMPTHVKFGIKLLEMNGHLTPHLRRALDSPYLLCAVSHVHSINQPDEGKGGCCFLT